MTGELLELKKTAIGNDPYGHGTIYVVPAVKDGLADGGIEVGCQRFDYENFMENSGNIRKKLQDDHPDFNGLKDTQKDSLVRFYYRIGDVARAMIQLEQQRRNSVKTPMTVGDTFTYCDTLCVIVWSPFGKASNGSLLVPKWDDSWVYFVPDDKSYFRMPDSDDRFLDGGDFHKQQNRKPQ
jgi:hypothetical protein